MARTSTASTRDISKTVKLSQGQNERIQRVCERLDISVNSFLVHAIANALVQAEGRISNADLAENLTREMLAMFAPLIEDAKNMGGPTDDQR